MQTLFLRILAKADIFIRIKNQRENETRALRSMGSKTAAVGTPATLTDAKETESQRSRELVTSSGSPTQRLQQIVTQNELGPRSVEVDSSLRAEGGSPWVIQLTQLFC